MPAQLDRYFRLNLEVSADNPNLLAGLDRWLELGLISDQEVRELCRNNLTCYVPAVVVQSAPELQPISFEEPESPSIPPRHQPTVLGNIWTAFKDELSVRWLLFCA